MNRKALHSLVLFVGIGCGVFMGPSIAQAWTCGCCDGYNAEVKTNDECIAACGSAGVVGSQCSEVGPLE